VSRPDVLVVSLGTTRGWRMGDLLFVEQLRAAGAATEAVRVRLGAAGRLRRGYPVNDLVEALAARRAARGAQERLWPRAIVLSTTTAAMLHPGFGVPYAVRLDAPAALNRPGLACSILRPLERRALGAASLVLPWSPGALEALPPGHGPAVVLPPPLLPSGPPLDPPEPLAVAYVPDPKAKGLDLLCDAWSAAAPEGTRLEVFGIERERALAHLRRHGREEPESVEWRGMTGAGEFRAALRRARVYVGSARWEDFGQAPLEALADGALLATVPSGGPFEALRHARELAPELVADELSGAALARCVRAAFAIDDGRLRAYREQAALRIRDYAPDALLRIVSDSVLPALLG
jgi:hypothetical protein